MRMPRVRFTLRRMMIAVAALAAFLGIARSISGVARERQHRFQKLAGDYASQCRPSDWEPGFRPGSGSHDWS